MFDRQWWRDVSLIITAGIKQKYIISKSQMLNVLGKCALMMTVMVKSSAQIEPFYASKGNKIWFILLFSNCFFAIGAVRYVGLGIRPTYSKTWICNNDLLDLGINNNNNNSLHLYSAFLLFSKHSKRSTLWGGCLLVHHQGIRPTYSKTWICNNDWRNIHAFKS